MTACVLSSSGQTVTNSYDCVNYGTTTPWNPLWNFNNISQRMISDISIGNGFFHGYLERLPAGYNNPANASKTYPVIIFFHGYASRGNGSPSNLCRLFKDMGSDLATHLSIPGRIERQPQLFTQNDGVQNREFIVISPQFNQYTRLVSGTPDHFPSGDEVEKVIDYVEDNYRIDSRRIYLTGLSNGANMITEYAGSSLARAKRVAAIMPVSLCSDLNHENNTSRGIDAKYIGQAKLKTWFVYCVDDFCGSGPKKFVSQAWVDAINAVPGHSTPRFTVLKNVDPPTLYNCSDTNWHDAWSRAYNPDFKASYINGTGANDGINQNMYQWFAASTNAVLPVVLKDYLVRFNDGNVEVSWVTTDEKDNASFTIERAGEDQHFVSIGTIPGLGTHAGEHPYSFVDKNPLSGINYYRLVQTDIDGKQSYFDIKKILNKPGGGPAIVVSPNPFVNDISAFISLDRSQKIMITVTDMAGKVLKRSNAVFGPGNTEIKVNATDLPSGMYFFRIHGENMSFTSKVVKN
jgi:predicted esterase